MLLISTVALLAAAAPASAEKLCVAPQAGCAPAQTYATVQQALDAAAADPDTDDVYIGAGVHTAPGPGGFTYANAALITIQGVRYETVLRAPPTAARVLDVTQGGLMIYSLEVEIHPDAPAQATGIRTGADVFTVNVTDGGSPAHSRRGIVLTEPGTIADVEIDLSKAPLPGTTGIRTEDVALLSRAKISATNGVRVGPVGAQLDRMTVDASLSGVLWAGPGSMINSLVEMSGAGGASSTGIGVSNTKSVEVLQSTIAEAGSGTGTATAIASRSSGAEESDVTLRNTVVRGFDDAFALTSSPDGNARLAHAWTNIDASPARITKSGNTLLFSGAGTRYDADAGFVDEAGGDFHLVGSSPLVDAGSTDGVVESPDLDNLTRVLGGRSDTPRIDVGAYEYKRSAPTVTIAGPTSGAAGEPLTFDATTKDANPGETVAATWSVDGAGASPGASFTRTFTEPGSYVVQVEVTDASGLTAQTERAVVITAAPEPPPAPSPASAPALDAAPPAQPNTPAGPARPAAPRAVSRAPRLSGLVVSRGRARVRTDAPARITLKVQRRSGKRLRTVRTRTMAAKRAGRVSVRLGRLAKGRYRIVVTASSPAGVRSAPLRRGVTVR